MDRPLTNPSSKDVLGRLKNSSMAHFACHDISYATNPDDTHTLLEKEGPSGEPIPDQLSVGKILGATSQSVSGSWLVYFSAYATTHVKSKEFGDEKMHLAGALQIAEFRMPLAHSGPPTAMRGRKLHFYQDLSKYQADTRELAVAAALRRAVMKVRNEWLLKPEYSTRFVHFGA